MVDMSVKCAMCATDKHPSLMRSSDTCNDCAERSRPCHNCTRSSVAKSWVNGICPICGFCHDNNRASDASEVTNAIKNTSSKPSIIDLLLILGWCLFGMMGLSGMYFMSQDGGLIFGASVIIAGIFQLSIFLGFSAIIDQLYQINQNTAKAKED